MRSFSVSHDLPLGENTGGVGLYSCRLGKSGEVEQVENLSGDWTLGVPEDKGRPELSRRR